jgi:hypothetical protein
MSGTIRPELAEGSPCLELIAELVELLDVHPRPEGPPECLHLEGRRTPARARSGQGPPQQIVHHTAKRQGLPVRELSELLRQVIVQGQGGAHERSERFRAAFESKPGGGASTMPSDAARALQLSEGSSSRAAPGTNNHPHAESGALPDRRAAAVKTQRPGRPAWQTGVRERPIRPRRAAGSSPLGASAAAPRDELVRRMR